MKIDESIRAKLREPFPPEAISQHPTKTFLSTIKAIYIVERLNDVFGIGGWNMEHEIVADSPEYVSMKGRLLIGNHDDPNYFTTPWQYGGHGKIGKNTEPADGYKSAVTDCQSKCASYLEIGIDVFKGLVGKKPYQKPPGGVQADKVSKAKPLYPKEGKSPSESTSDAQKGQLDSKGRFVVGPMMASQVTKIKAAAFEKCGIDDTTTLQVIEWYAKIHGRTFETGEKLRLEIQTIYPLFCKNGIENAEVGKRLGEARPPDGYTGPM